MFTVYSFVVAVIVGTIAFVTVAPVMARTGLTSAFAHVAAGLSLGLAGHLLVDLAIRERIDGSEDWLGGAVAGVAAGFLWWFQIRDDTRETRRDG